MKPSGRLIFVEHGRAPDAGVARWQDRLTPLWKRIGGGCHLNRRIDEIIKGAGFQIPALAASYIPGPRPMTYTYQGIAHSRRTTMNRKSRLTVSGPLSTFTLCCLAADSQENPKRDHYWP